MAKKADTKTNRKIKAVVDMMFDDIPYSGEVTQAQEKIETALNAEFDKIKADRHEDEVLEELMGRYVKLSQMAELAGYPAESAEKWRGETQAVNIRPLKKEIWEQRLRIYLTSAFAVFALLQMFWLIYNITADPVAVIANVIVIVVDLLIASFPFRKYLRTEKTAEGSKYDTDSYKYLRIRSDKYAKRLLNDIALLFAVVFTFVASELSFYFFGNSKSAEFAENFFNNSIVIEIPVFLLIKNILSLRMIRRRINIPDNYKYKKHIIGITIFSAVYWIGVTTFTVIKSKDIAYPGNVFMIAGIFFGMFVIVYDFTLRRKVTFRNIVINMPRIAIFTAVAVAVSGFMVLQQDTWYTQSYINSVPVVEHNTHKIEYNDETGVYTITKTTDDFKILHLTDIHIGGSLYSYSKDIKALKACYAEIEHMHPDLVVVTGDLSFPLGIMSMSLNNTAPVGQFAAFMRNTGIPWAFTYGNHDTESLASANKQELNEVYKSLSFKTSGNLLYPYTQPDVMGRNNQLIEIRNSGGSLNTGLFMIDSNAYTGEGINVYDYIHDDQVDWYADEVRRMNNEAGIEKETKQRGAELITIHADSTWESEQIPLESIK